MTELYTPPFITPRLQTTVDHCVEHYEDMAQEVMQEIEDSDYLYGIDRFEESMLYHNNQRHNGWKVHEYPMVTELGKQALAKVVLVASGRLLIRVPDDFNTVTQEYVPTAHGESPMTVIATYVNTVGLVDDLAFREKQLAFLEV